MDDHGGVVIPEPVTLYTADGVRIDAGHTRGDGNVCFVLAHGFTCSWRQPALRRIAGALHRHGGVIGLDFRGHGRSGGRSTVGDREVLDVDAAVAAARRRGYERIVLTGFSMGGAIVVRHAALHGGVDAVVSVSAPARWYYRGTVPMRRVHWVIERRVGRMAVRLARGHGSRRTDGTQYLRRRTRSSAGSRRYRSSSSTGTRILSSPRTRTSAVWRRGRPEGVVDRARLRARRDGRHT